MGALHAPCFPYKTSLCRLHKRHDEGWCPLRPLCGLRRRSSLMAGGPSRFLLLSFSYFSATSYHVTDHPCVQRPLGWWLAWCAPVTGSALVPESAGPLHPDPVFGLGHQSGKGRRQPRQHRFQQTPAGVPGSGAALPPPPCSWWHLEMSAHWLGSEMGQFGVQPSVLDAQNFRSMRQIKL